MVNEEISNKRRKLELDLLRIREEIQWKEREKEQMSKPKWWTYLVGVSVIPSFFLSYYLAEGTGAIICLVLWVIFFMFMIISLNNSKEGKEFKKIEQELNLAKKREKAVREWNKGLRIFSHSQGW